MDTVWKLSIISNLHPFWRKDGCQLRSRPETLLPYVDSSGIDDVCPVVIAMYTLSVLGSFHFQLNVDFWSCLELYISYWGCFNAVSMLHTTHGLFILCSNQYNSFLKYLKQARYSNVNKQNAINKTVVLSF